jgi:hypothetical protein
MVSNGRAAAIGLTIWTGLARGQAHPGALSLQFSEPVGSDISGPSISSLPPVIYVGDNFVIQGAGSRPVRW